MNIDGLKNSLPAPQQLANSLGNGLLNTRKVIQEHGQRLLGKITLGKAAALFAFVAAGAAASYLGRQMMHGPTNDFFQNGTDFCPANFSFPTQNNTAYTGFAFQTFVIEPAGQPFKETIVYAAVNATKADETCPATATANAAKALLNGINPQTAPEAQPKTPKYVFGQTPQTSQSSTKTPAPQKNFQSPSQPKAAPFAWTQAPATPPPVFTFKPQNKPKPQTRETFSKTPNSDTFSKTPPQPSPKIVITHGLPLDQRFFYSSTPTGENLKPVYPAKVPLSALFYGIVSGLVDVKDYLLGVSLPKIDFSGFFAAPETAARNQTNETIFYANLHSRKVTKADSFDSPDLAVAKISKTVLNASNHSAMCLNEKAEEQDEVQNEVQNELSDAIQNSDGSVQIDEMPTSWSNIISLVLPH